MTNPEKIIDEIWPIYGFTVPTSGFHQKSVLERILHNPHKTDTELADTFLDASSAQLREPLTKLARRFQKKIVVAHQNDLGGMKGCLQDYWLGLFPDKYRVSVDKYGYCTSNVDGEKHEYEFAIRVIRNAVKYHFFRTGQIEAPEDKQKYKEEVIGGNSLVEQLLAAYTKEKNALPRRHDVHLELNEAQREWYAKNVVDNNVHLSIADAPEVRQSIEKFDRFLDSKGADVLTNPQTAEKADNLFLRMLYHVACSERE
jgi:hypothetical protein